VVVNNNNPAHFTALSAFWGILKSIILFNRIVDSQGNCKVGEFVLGHPCGPLSAYLLPGLPAAPVLVPQSCKATVGHIYRSLTPQQQARDCCGDWSSLLALKLFPARSSVREAELGEYMVIHVGNRL
jgi:hypothetical protein